MTSQQGLDHQNNENIYFGTIRYLFPEKEAATIISFFELLDVLGMAQTFNLLKIGHPRPLIVYFCSFKNTFYRRKVCVMKHPISSPFKQIQF